MTDEAFLFRLRGALMQGLDSIFETPDVNDVYQKADSLEKWGMVADAMSKNLSTADRVKLENGFDQGRIPGFREANDAIWKATGQVFTMEVDKETRGIAKCYLAPQANREVGPTTASGRIHVYCSGKRSDKPSTPGMWIIHDVDIERIVHCPTPDVTPCECPEA